MTDTVPNGTTQESAADPADTAGLDWEPGQLSAGRPTGRPDRYQPGSAATPGWIRGLFGHRPGTPTQTRPGGTVLLAHPRQPLRATATALLLALLATFFAWTSAESVWLALGRAEWGTATVVRCHGSGLDERCRGTFTPAGGGAAVEAVSLRGTPDGDRRVGASFRARMVSASARTAYGPAWSTASWATGIVLTFLAGLAMAWATGANRLSGRFSRAATWATAGVGGPVVLLLGSMIATY